MCPPTRQRRWVSSEHTEKPLGSVQPLRLSLVWSRLLFLAASDKDTAFQFNEPSQVLVCLQTALVIQKTEGHAPDSVKGEGRVTQSKVDTAGTLGFSLGSSETLDSQDLDFLSVKQGRCSLRALPRLKCPQDPDYVGRGQMFGSFKTQVLVDRDSSKYIVLGAV